MKTRIMVVAVAMALTPMVAFAGTHSHVNPITAANSEIGMGFVQQQSNYSEDLPSPADVENGSMSGFTVFAKDNFGLMGIHNLYASVKYTRISGNTTYSEGGVATEPAGHVTNTVNVKLGKTMFLSSDSAVTPYVFGGYNDWYRTVPGGVANPENYTNGYVGVGAKYQFAATRHLVLAASGGVGEVIGANISATLDSYYSSVGFDTPNKLNMGLGSRPYYTLGLSADYRVQKHLHLIADVGYQDYMYGASSIHSFAGSGPTAGYTLNLNEPSSQTSNFAVGLSVAYGF